MLEIVGWIGAIAFCLCGAPQAYKCWKEGHATGVSHGLIWLWFIGEIFSMAYTYPKQIWPLFWNYTFNLIFLAAIVKFKYFPRSDNGQQD